MVADPASDSGRDLRLQFSLPRLGGRRAAREGRGDPAFIQCDPWRPMISRASMPWQRPGTNPSAYTVTIPDRCGVHDGGISACAVRVSMFAQLRIAHQAVFGAFVRAIARGGDARSRERPLERSG
jgi:hypothetical protein